MRTSLKLQLRRVLPVIGEVVVVLAILASSAQAAPSFRSGNLTSYYGLTSQEAPLVLQVSKDGRVLKRVTGALDMNCTDNGSPFVMTVRDSWADVIVGLNRSFKQSYTDTNPLPNGTTIDESGEFTGRFDRKRKTVKGTWRLQLAFHEADGSTMSCESGVLHFSARRMQG
jgi:hypothetical protein